MNTTIRIALVQFKPAKGDYVGTLARLSRVFETVAGLHPHPVVITLPETALTGYFLEGGVQEFAKPAEQFASDLNGAWHAGAERALSAGVPLVDVVAGFYELYNDAYYNSVLYATLGNEEPEVIHVHRKVFLPTYGMFDEERFVDHGLEVRAFDTRWGRAAMLICEDAWHGIAATVAALDGAQILFVPSASPARGACPEPDEAVPAPTSVHRWARLARDRSEEHGMYVAVTQLVGSEGGKAFAGGSIVTGPSGDVRARGPLWEEAVIPVDLDLRDITRARAETPLLSDLQTLLPHMIRSLRRTIPGDA